MNFYKLSQELTKTIQQSTYFNSFNRRRMENATGQKLNSWSGVT